MPDLTALLNKGHEQVQVTRMVDPFDVKMGPIPEIVPVLRDDGRAFASGKVVLAERLNALLSGDTNQISAWGVNYFDLADACITFEDMLKAQPDSPLLKGIRGVVETSDGLYIAVDAEAVSKAAKGNMRYFQVRDSETVTYGTEDNKVSKQANDVVLLRYAKPEYVALTPDQFNSVDAKAMKRSDFIHGRDMEQSEIVNNGRVVHPVYKALLGNRLAVPLVNETFRFNGRVYDYNANMGVFIPGEPQENAEIRAFYTGKLGERSGLWGNSLLGWGDFCLVGIVEKGAPGAAKK